MTAPAAAEVAPRTSSSWIIALASQKGGVGKTTLALGLASTTADLSGQPLVIDCDVQGTATEIAEAAAAGAEAAGREFLFDFTASTDPAELATLRDTRRYDTIFVDLPGSLDGQEVLAEILKVADLALVPMIPERAAITPTLRTVAAIEAAGVAAYVVLNQVDPLRGSQVVVDQAFALLDSHGVPHLKSYVRRYVAHSQAQLNGQMITDYRGDRSYRSALLDMNRLQGELLMVLDRRRQELLEAKR